MELNNLIGTYFENGSQNIVPKCVITFEELEQGIRSEQMAERWRILNNLKKNNLNEDAAKYKLSYPYVCMNAIFQARNNTDWIPKSITWVVPWDIDAKDNEGKDMNDLRKKIEETPSTILCCKSTSGKGLRGFSLLKKESFEPDAQIYYAKMRDVIYPYLNKIWDCKLDHMQGRFSQPWFMTYDENVYHNWEAKPIEDVDYSYVSMETIESIVEEGEEKPSVNLKMFLEKLSSVKENKHIFVLRLAKLMGGYFAGKLFTKNLSEEKIIAEANSAIVKNHFIKDYDAAKKTFLAGFNYGKKEPISKESLKLKNATYNIISSLIEISIDNNYEIKRHPYIMVGNDYYEEIEEEKIDEFKNKQTIKELKFRKRQAIVDKINVNFLKKIPVFKDFCNEPNYVDYKPIVNGHYNIAKPLIHEIKEGEFPTIRHLFNHIFGDQVNLGYAYIQLGLLKPKQKLPALCLVSQENQTGKSTFINLVDSIFYGNCAIVKNDDIKGDFNAHYIAKNWVCVDETKLEGHAIMAKIKALVTQKSTTVNEKNVSVFRVPTHTKLVIASNKELDFLEITTEDLRFWVVKVPPIKSFDPLYEDKIVGEIPAFIHYLINQPLIYPEKKDRLWFSPEDLGTKALEEIKEYNKSPIWHQLRDKIDIWFLQNPSRNEMIITPSAIWEADPYIQKNYSVKHIGRILKEEFGATYMGNTVIRFFNDLKGKNEIGRPYVIFRVTNKKSVTKICNEPTVLF